MLECHIIVFSAKASNTLNEERFLGSMSSPLCIVCLKENLATLEKTKTIFSIELKFTNSPRRLRNLSSPSEKGDVISLVYGHYLIARVFTTVDKHALTIIIIER